MVTKDNQGLESGLLMKISRAEPSSREKVYLEHYEAQFNDGGCNRAPTVHLGEVWRVLKPGRKYLLWCPITLGHRNRAVYLSRFSYRALITEMSQAGFAEFRSCLFNRFGAGITASWKVFLESSHSFGIGTLWSHLGGAQYIACGRKNRPA